MNKDVIITIRGIQKAVDSPETLQETTTVSEGIYSEAGGKSFVTYTERSEDGDLTDCRLKFDGKTMEVTRKGKPDTKLAFAPGQRTGSAYNTPYGNLLMGVDTHVYEITREEQKINLHAEYDLEINDEIVSYNEIFIEIAGTI